MSNELPKEVAKQIIHTGYSVARAVLRAFEVCAPNMDARRDVLSTSAHLDILKDVAMKAIELEDKDTYAAASQEFSSFCQRAWALYTQLLRTLPPPPTPVRYDYTFSDGSGVMFDTMEPLLMRQLDEATAQVEEGTISELVYFRRILRLLKQHSVEYRITARPWEPAWLLG